MKRAYDVHLIFNHRDQALVEVIDDGLRQRGLVPWLWNRDAPAEHEAAEIASIESTPASAIFLGPAGWGPTHRRFATLAQDLGRPVIPVVLPGWDSRDLSEPFHRLRRIEFRSEDDAEALGELASRIVDSAYEPAAAARPSEAQTAAPGRRLIVYVPARSQTVESWSSLRQHLEKEPQLQDCAWYGHSYTASAWSRESLEEYALDLETRIGAEVLAANADDPSRPITGITLLGHSFGGVLARMAYLISAGRYQEIKHFGSEWWGLVDRIVLFAAPNRGIEVKRIPWHERLAVHWPFGKLGALARDQLKGSEAITTLRIRWIRFFAELDPRGRPAVVQFLGKGDRLVSRDDSLDIEQFSEAWQSDVPGATHADVHVIPEGETRRYLILRQGILEAKAAGLSGEERGRPRKNPVVISCTKGDAAWEAPVPAERQHDLRLRRRRRSRGNDWCPDLAAVQVAGGSPSLATDIRRTSRSCVGPGGFLLVQPLLLSIRQQPVPRPAALPAGHPLLDARTHAPLRSQRPPAPRRRSQVLLLPAVAGWHLPLRISL